MSDMRCPVCNKQMKVGTLDLDDSMGTVWMSIMPCDCVCSYGASKAVWQELIRARAELNKANAELEYIKEQVEKNNVFDNTRKALDVAKKWLMKIGYLNMSDHGLGSEKMMTDWCKTVALHGLKEIETALEQKDVK